MLATVWSSRIILDHRRLRHVSARNVSGNGTSSFRNVWTVQRRRNVLGTNALQLVTSVADAKSNAPAKLTAVAVSVVTTGIISVPGIRGAAWTSEVISGSNIVVRFRLEEVTAVLVIG
jgi:hypothetical protein